MNYTNTLDYLWYEALQYTSMLHNHTPKSVLQKNSSIEKAFSTTPDISILLQYSFYELIHYHNVEAMFPHWRELPRRYVGLAINVGDALTYRVFTVDKIILS